MNICTEFENKLVAFIENQLTSEEHRKFEDHLKSCSICQKEYAAIGKLYEILNRDEVKLPAPDFFESLKIKVRQKVIVPRRSYVPWIIKIMVPAFAAAVLLLILYRPNQNMEMNVPVSNLLEDREVASYAINKLVNEDLMKELTVIEEYLPSELDESLDELTAKEKIELIKDLSEKFKIGT